MGVITALLIITLCTSTTGFSDENHARRILFGDQKANAVPTSGEESLFGHSFKKLLDGFLSKDPDDDDNQQSNSFSKLAMLKKFLSSFSTSSDKNSKIDKLFQILGTSTNDENNQSSSKLNRIFGFLNNQDSTSSSNNFGLAKKLLNLAQGTSGSSSLSFSDMKSLAKLLGK